MAKDAETSKPKHLDPTSEYYFSSQANSGDPDCKPTRRPWCTFCNLVGHTQEKCYRRLGIAPPCKGRRKGRGSPTMSQNAIGFSWPTPGLCHRDTEQQPFSQPGTGYHHFRSSGPNTRADATPHHFSRILFIGCKLSRPHFEEPDWTGGDTPPVTGGDLPPSPTTTPSPDLSGITTGLDPEISSPASPPSSPTAASPTLGRGKRQKKAPSILKDYLKDLGPLNYFLGIEVARGPHGLFLSQHKYALDILSESGLSASKPAAFPMEQNHSLALTGGPLLSDLGPYRRLIGRLIYLTITRPDICYAVHVLSQFMQSPRSQHWDAALWVLRYLKAAPAQGLFLLADSPLQIYAFCDSDWASCPLTRHSVTEYFISLGNSPISWRTKKQPTVSRSSAEAEYHSMAITTWLKSFLLSLGIHHDRPMRLFCDKQAALHIASNPVFHERTKHIKIDCHYVRDQLLAGNISTAHVRTAQQVTDIFTKALGGVTSFIIFAASWAFEIFMLQLEGSINWDYAHDRTTFKLPNQSCGCLGCDTKPKLIASVNEPLKGQKLQTRTVSKPSLLEDFWTTSTCDMDKSAAQSRGSISSISTSNQALDAHGSGNIPSEFVNHGKLLLLHRSCRSYMD
ncbi:hypothetical protein RJ639_005104 [Escallonia herrerae]|uniref:Uncharacterized protein n=1 Tax=Escallonia herrerae TaxID=1293975 RepID=A0AA89AVX9_9ASTE|nr:hypothetical protein RJ639_005104 [Escallonia herrerae]